MLKQWQAPCIYVVATPIGNLDDLSTRARKLLIDADLILCEDTRRTRQLLSHLGINKKSLVSYQGYAEAAKAEPMVRRIVEECLTAVLVSDAGTPCISDPGYRLVDAARTLNIPVHPVPGASALTALLSVSGLPTDRFTFVGFLPAKLNALKTEIAAWNGSIVFFESLRRLGKTLQLIADRFPGARVVIGRELTKLHEEIVRMDIAEALVWVDHHPVLKGEVVVMVNVGETPMDGDKNSTEDLRAEIVKAVRGGATIKDLMQQFRHRGLSRSELYQTMLDSKRK